LDKILIRNQFFLKKGPIKCGLKILENLLGRAQVAQGQPSSSGGMRCMDELVFYWIGIYILLDLVWFDFSSRARAVLCEQSWKTLG